MTNIGIFNSSWGTFGGGEKYILLIASILSKIEGLRVELLIDKPSLHHDQLSAYYSIDLGKVKIKNISRGKISGIMSSYDVGIITSNVKSFGNHAKRNIYILQIPYYKITPVRMFGKTLRENPKEGIKDILRLSLLRNARKSDLILVYSEFTQNALRNYHNIDSTVLYPPIDDFRGKGIKQKVVLSVGRFFRGVYNDKRYDIMIEAFKRLCRNLPDSAWEYRLAGSCAADHKSMHYMNMLRESAEGYPVKFFVNAKYGDLQKLYDEATIFWHAAGYGGEEVKCPERMEHFGMSTVEAMSAMCVPVVINKGGQKEIITHRKNGFLWNTLDELERYTLQIINDSSMTAKIRNEARSRFMDFSRDRFAQNLIQITEKMKIGGKLN